MTDSHKRMNDGSETPIACAATETIPALANDNPDLLRRARWLCADWAFGVDDVLYPIRQRQGRIVAFERGPLLMRSWRFAVRGSAAPWLALWQPVPKPGWAGGPSEDQEPTRRCS